MPFEKILFYLFAAMIIGSAMMVITSRNSVRAVLLLVLTFVSSSCLWILLGSEYLALTLIVVYVGAVMVLFLFVVMMLDVNLEPLKEGFIRHLPLAVLIAMLLVAQIGWVFFDWSKMLPSFEQLTPRAADYSSIHELGIAMYTQYFYAVEIAAVLLLVAMVAAVGLTFRGVKNRKSQNISKQIRVRAQDRVRLIKD